MNGIGEIPVSAAFLTATLLLLGASVTLIGSLGLLRLRSFYERTHAPTLGTTLGTAFVAAASMVYFSFLQSRPVLHELLIIAFVTVTTPVTLTVLVRAARFRDTAEDTNSAPQRDGQTGSNKAAGAAFEEMQ
jgi:multicomponent K+:H+ antiporter subunit G